VPARGQKTINGDSFGAAAIGRRVVPTTQEGVPYEFSCECANADCMFRVALPNGLYQTIRLDPKQFVVLPQHYTPEVEDLVAEEGRQNPLHPTNRLGQDP
jgi:hypothetical protein